MIPYIATNNSVQNPRGGFMSSWAVDHTNRFKAAVIGAAVTDLISFAGMSDVTPSFPGVYLMALRTI